MPTLKDLADRIHRELSIADVIGRHVELHRKGARLTGLCPFHDDHRPSLSVDVDRGLYHCFVCKAGGDAIKFVQEIEGVDFKGALVLLAGQMGIPFDMYRGVSREVAETSRKREDTLLEALDLARDFFRRTLSEGTGRDYVERRQIPPEIAERFELGFAPPRWDGLLAALRGKGFREQTGVEAGLLIFNEERQTHYDRFRGRLMFPIWDALGRPVAFGGRVVDPEDQDSPKYINSPETPVYTKGNVVYAFHLAKDAIRAKERAVLCEGYMDVIAAHSAGVTEAVASLGTALTENQAKLLRRHAKQVVLLYDADAAGQQATLRGCEILRRNGLTVRIAPLPAGLDPDDLVRQNGASALQKLVEEAQPALRYLTQWLLSSPDGPGDPLEHRIWVLDQISPAVLSNMNEISRSGEIGQLAEWIGIGEDLVRSHLAKGGGRAAQDLHREMQQRKLDRPPATEQGLVRCLLEKPDLGDHVRRRDEALTWITDPRVRAWTERLLAGDENPEASGRFALDTISQLAAGDPADEALLREILMAEEDYSDPEQVLVAVLDRLEREADRRRLREVSKPFVDAPHTELPAEQAREILLLGRKIHRPRETPPPPTRL